MFRPILPKLMEIRALNRSNLLFCLDVTAINPRPANHNIPRLKLSQVMAATHMRGFSPINRDPCQRKRGFSSSTFAELLFLLVWFSETLIRFPAASFQLHLELLFLFLQREKRGLERVIFSFLLQ